MLFSHPTLARYLSERFECAWESVRAVPKVTIDFGNGRTLKRTLNGNILTWFTDSEGRVVDVTPGIVSPRELATRATRALRLYAASRFQPFPTRWLAQVHAGRVDPKLSGTGPALARVLKALAGVGKQLDKDTDFNKRRRYPMTRKILADNPGKGPRQLRDRIYKNVMGTDLADPYLGLAPYVLGGEPGRG